MILRGQQEAFRERKNKTQHIIYGVAIIRARLLDNETAF